jgi:putative transcriptional regulator
MAIVRKTLAQIRASQGRVDHAILDATTEEDIRQHMIEDGEDPDAPVIDGELTILPEVVRYKLGMTQEQFAEALRIPLGTLRNWEQGRVKPDPAARSLLLAVYDNPKAVLRALRTSGLLKDRGTKGSNEDQGIKGSKRQRIGRSPDRRRASGAA